MESLEQTLNAARNINPTIPTATQISQQVNDGGILNVQTTPCNSSRNPMTDLEQPLDLSTKQTTPMSTDTGFCNESFSLDVRQDQVPTIHANHGRDNVNVGMTAWPDNHRSNEETRDDNLIAQPYILTRAALNLTLQAPSTSLEQ